ncbi:MAG TPA: hypothetical protein VGG33_02645 [Polyangia bacterium]
MFTETFNRPPKVSIAGPATLFRLEPGTFVATVEDDDGGGRTIRWGRKTACPATLAEALVEDAPRISSSSTDPARVDSFKENFDGEVCLVVIVTDGSGAQGFAAKPITIKSRVLVIRGPERVVSQETVTFTAAYLEPPDTIAKARLAWGSASGPNACDQARSMADALAGIANLPSAGTSHMTKHRTSFCVAVVATDEFGARISATLSVPIANPIPEIRMVEPMPATNEVGLFTRVRLSALDLGEDAIVARSLRDFSWVVTVKPTGEKLPAAQIACGTEPNSDICFETTKDGIYQVELTVTEGGSATAAQPRELVVKDRPPCIRATDPGLATLRVRQDYDKARTFHIKSVDDDADPWPRNCRDTKCGFEFVWSVGKRGESGPTVPSRQGYAVDSSFTLEENRFQLGDEVDVRVDYFDRLGALGRPEFTSRCPVDRPTCELAPGCYQRFTWTVVYR